MRRNLCDALLHVVEGNVQAFLYVFGFPLAGIPDIQDEWRCTTLQFFRNRRSADPFRRPNQVGPVGECGHSPVQITSQVIEADAPQA
jgi:hypothetical protein